MIHDDVDELLAGDDEFFWKLFEEEIVTWDRLSLRFHFLYRLDLTVRYKRFPLPFSLLMICSFMVWFSSSHGQRVKTRSPFNVQVTDHQVAAHQNSRTNQ